MAESKDPKPAVPSQAPTAPKKDRSPNYPAIGLTEALGYAEKIWKLDKRNPLSVDVACRHMGYKAKNGASLPIVAAMKRYGLLVTVGTEVRISDDANTIFLAPADHPERHQLVRKIAMLPILFREVLKRFPDGLPSDENLRFRLRQEWEFANDKAADSFIKSLREAVSLAGIAAGEEIADNGANVIAQEANMTSQNPAIAQPIQPAGGRMAPPSLAQTTQIRPWDLGEGVVISISVPAKLSRGNIAKLKRYVNSLEGEASISWDDEESK